MNIYKKIVSPLLDRFDSETIHELTRKFLHLAEISPLSLKLLELFLRGPRFVDERLHMECAGIEFENPVLVGAGWDKKGVAVKALWQLGFAGVEVGSVLVHSQPGNPKSRQFVVAPGVAINHLGFNSPGMEAVANHLERYRGSGIPLGVNIGKNRDVSEQDAPSAYAAVAKRLYDLASYFVVNVSSPNTPGLRKLQDKPLLTAIIVAVKNAVAEQGNQKPLFVKIAPELTKDAVNDVIEVVVDHYLTGIVATNTTADSTIKGKYGKQWQNVAGGLSGDDEDFRKMGTELIRHIYRETKGKIEIIGVGGVKDGSTALEKIRAGAKLVQIVTAIRGEGPSVARRVNRELVDWMERKGVKTLGEVVGSEEI